MDAGLFTNFSLNNTTTSLLADTYENLEVAIDGALAAKPGSNAQRGYVRSALSLATALAASAASPLAIPTAGYAQQLTAQFEKARANIREDLVSNPESAASAEANLVKSLGLAKKYVAEMASASVHDAAAFPEVIRQFLMGADLALLKMEALSPQKAARRKAPRS